MALHADSPETAAALVAEVEGVRRLARRLVADAGTADDVAQETMRVALERSPREGWPLPRWLHGVARNVARGWRRSEGRRRRHEAAAARSEAQAADLDVGERVARRRLVIDAVTALPEPYGRVVVLRYFDGLPPRAIAARLGIPVETVRTRQKRALALLRAEMDRRHGGDRRAWCLALTPLTAPRPGPLSSFRDLLAMSSTAKVAATVAVLLAFASIGIGIRLVASGSGTSPGSVGSASGRDSAGVEAAPAAPSESGLAANPSVAGAPARTATAAASGTAAASEAAWRVDGGVEGGAGFSGVVLGADGMPLPGARVRLAPNDPILGYLGVDTASRWSVLAAVTDAQGRFAFVGVRPASGYALLVRASGHAMSLLEGMTLLADEQAELAPLRMTHGTRLAGRVVDRAGAGVAGARVGVAPRVIHRLGFVLARIDALPDLEAQATTDAAGNWSADDVEAGGKTLVVEKEGYASVAVSALEVKAGAEQAVAAIVLEPAHRLEGRALFRDGRAAAGARVLVTRPDGDVGVSADAAENGDFAVDGLPDGPCLVAGFVPGLAPVVAQESHAGARNVLLRFSNPGALTVRVVAGEARAPVREFDIQAVPDGVDPSDALAEVAESTLREALGPRRVRSGAGEVTFDPIEPRSWRFEVRAEGFLPLRSEAVAVAAGPAGPPLVLALARGGGIRGVVVGPDGAPVVGARVWLARGDIALHPEQEVPESGFVVRIGPDDEVAPLEAYTTAEGEFAFDAPAPGTHGLTVRAAGLAPAFVGGLVVGEQPLAALRVALVSGAALSGRVAFAGRPLPPDLHLRLDGAQGPLDAVTDGQGAFAFEHVPPGRFALLPLLGDPTTPRLSDATRADFVARGIALEVDLRDGEKSVRALLIPPLPWIEGSISGLSASSPLEGHDVLLLPEGIVGPDHPFVHRARTDAEGRFVVRDVLPGPWQVTVHAFERVLEEGRPVERARSAEIDLTVPPTPAAVPLRVSFVR